MKQRYVTSGFVLLSAVVGCGNVSGRHGPSAEIASLHGQIFNDKQIEVNGPIRAAIVWSAGIDKATQLSDLYRVTQDVAVSAEFPANFRIAPQAPPPSAAMTEVVSIDADSEAISETLGVSDTVLEALSSIRMAIGRVYVYEDGNQNEVLDLVVPVDTQVSDRLLGTTEETIVQYQEAGRAITQEELDQQLPNDVPIVLGYSLVDPQVCQSNGECNRTQPKVYGPDERITVRFDPQNPLLKQTLCQYEQALAETSPYPSADNLGLECAEDGLSFQFNGELCGHYPVTQGICPKTEYKCWSGRTDIPDPTNPPDGWPCSVPPGR